ncbi:flippase [Paraburkholderia phenoliruptrix]|uniref:Polysaccharide transporter, PST family n=2 Tax=Paraburkholderia phenoliruptrix TaxID=252970 RepID=K0DV45_9BURK|nr:flippase [Paraburkholderia phenoliruptrix]AFT87823.1 polysaccharide transporter, PST family [Paraburkholderia phenoliruptrix BR3459a]MDR6418058.1 PST family polysaccharide transporter [Paraburkholderia phenoliruptrix]CAB4046728.1 Putative O-antigen transporter [Paraburkholderia phenoliruptrix]
MTTPIRKTLLYLILIQGGNYIVPLLMLPYLGHVLGAREFGVLAYCQAVAQYMVLLTDYGFNFTATRLVSVKRDHPEGLAEVYTSTFAARLVLVAAALLLIVAGIAYVPDLRDHADVLAALFVGIVANAVTPIWLFQGLERMRALVLPTFVSRLLGLVFLYLAVKGPGDAALAALGVSLGNVLLAVCALWILHRNRLVKLVGISATKIAEALKDGFPLFFSFVLISFYVNFNSILLNYFHGPEVVGQFAMADKIRVAAQAMFMVISQAFYPRISQYHTTDRQAAQRLMRMAMLAVFSTSISLFIGIELLAAWGIETWVGPQFDASIPLLRLEAVLPPIISVAVVFGDLGLLAQGRARSLTNVFLGATVLHLLYVVPLTRYGGAKGTIAAVILTEVVGAAAFMWLYFRGAAPRARSAARMSVASPASQEARGADAG